MYIIIYYNISVEVTGLCIAQPLVSDISTTQAHVQSQYHKHKACDMASLGQVFSASASALYDRSEQPTHYYNLSPRL